MTSGPPQALRGELVRVHESAARFFRSQLPGSWVPGYLAGRRFSPAVQDRWHAGYAPASRDALTQYLRAAGYRDALIEASGLARRSRRGALTDLFRDRVMLPVWSGDGDIVAFTGRAAEHASPGVPKYLNSPGTSLYRKSEVLFGLWEARGALASGARPVIVEGPFDAIAVTTASRGRYAGVSPCGAVLTADQAGALAMAVRLRAAGVLVAFDSDQAGHRAAVAAYRLLAPLTDLAAAVALPAGQDPAQILSGHSPAALAWMLASRTQPLADLAIEAEVERWTRWLRHAEGQIGALRAAAPLVAALPPSQVARQVSRLASRLGLDHAIVTEAVTDALTELPAAGPARSDDGATAACRDRRDRTSAAVRAASLDHSGGTQQAIISGRPAAAGQSQAGQPPARPALRAGRVAG